MTEVNLAEGCGYYEGCGCHKNINAPLRPVKDFEKCNKCHFWGFLHCIETGKRAEVRCRLECEGNTPNYPKECGQVHCPSNNMDCCACCPETRCRRQQYALQHKQHGLYCPNKNQSNLGEFVG